MKTKLYVINDRSIKMILRVQAIEKPWEDQSFHVLQPAEGKLIEFEIPEGSFPYIKIWETGQAMISWMKD